MTSSILLDANLQELEGCFKNTCSSMYLIRSEMWSIFWGLTRETMHSVLPSEWNYPRNQLDLNFLWFKSKKNSNLSRITCTICLVSSMNYNDCHLVDNYFSLNNFLTTIIILKWLE